MSPEHRDFRLSHKFLPPPLPTIYTHALAKMRRISSFFGACNCNAMRSSNSASWKFWNWESTASANCREISINGLNTSTFRPGGVHMFYIREKNPKLIKLSMGSLGFGLISCDHNPHFDLGANPSRRGCSWSHIWTRCVFWELICVFFFYICHFSLCFFTWSPQVQFSSLPLIRFAFLWA